MRDPVRLPVHPDRPVPAPLVVRCKLLKTRHLKGRKEGRKEGMKEGRKERRQR